MSEPIVFGERPAAVPANGASVEIFDPPMCCPTGVCGPTIDPALLDMNEMVLALKSEGIPVARYQMASHAQAFVNNREVFRLVREKQLAALPITVVNGRVLKVGAYPTLAEVREAMTNGANDK
jgi:Arsenical resistance operon protein ArsD